MAIRFDLRGMTAGRAELSDLACAIRYNPVLLAENPEEFLGEIVPHEIAHVIARRCFGAGLRPHGREWQRVMLV